MRALTVEIRKLFPPVRAEEIAAALRKDLAEIADTLKSSLPAGALASLEQEVRALGTRIGENRASLQDHPVIAEIERSLADLRERLGAMAPVGDIANLAETVKELSRKADTIASQAAAPDGLHRLDDAIGALRSLATQIASPADIAGLSRDIHALAEKIDNSARPDSGAAMMTLDKRLADMAAAFDKSRAESVAIPADFEAIIKKLADRLESVEVRSADQGALRNLEGRIVGLVEKLDASEARLSRLDSVERGVGDLLEQINGLRTQNEKKLQAIQQELIDSTTRAVSAPAEAIRRDVATLKELQGAIDRRTQDTFEAVYGTIEQVVDRLATIEEGLRGKDGRETKMEPASPSRVPFAAKPAPPPVADAPASASLRDRLIMSMAEPPVPAKPAAQMPQPRQPIVSDLPPDAPLEPGFGGRRIRGMATAIDRIAASEASAGVSPAAVDADLSVRANFVAAARRAAQAVTGGQASQPAPRWAAAGENETARQPGASIGKLGPRIKSLLVGISVIALMLGALRLAIDFFTGTNSTQPSPPASQTEATPSRSPPGAPAIAPPPIAPLAPPSPSPIKGKGAASEDITRTASGSANASGLGIDTAPRTAAAAGDPTGSVPPQAASRAEIQDAAQVAAQVVVPQTAAFAPPRDPSKDALPAAIGGKALIAAAAAGDPAASYEVAARFADGKVVPQDLATAAIWFDRAARRGIAPAQFRLGSMYEKGVGLKKDLQEARRLYLAAADKGNAKAMHNLAVLYSEGIDGKPEYAVATQWFRKAAAYGVVDSQYNLAILYARGVGVDRNLVESYKWFALAAKGGDKDAGKKVLDVATHLDEQQLAAARQSVEAFIPESQPEEAISAKTPPGGWDQVALAAAHKAGSPRR